MIDATKVMEIICDFISIFALKSKTTITEQYDYS